jgi:hypothetical protein
MTVREQRRLRGVRHSGVGDSKPNIPDVGYDCAGRASGLGDLDGVAKRHDRDVVASNEGNFGLPKERSCSRESSHDQSEADSLHEQLRSQNRNEKVHSSCGPAD